MATVGDLAALSSWAYDPNLNALKAIGNGVWQETAKSEMPACGFFAFTLVNKQIDEVGIVPSRSYRILQRVRP